MRHTIYIIIDQKNYRIIYQTCLTLSLLSLMANTELHNVSIDLIIYLIVANVLDNRLINTLSFIRKNKKRPNKILICEFLRKNLENANLRKITVKVKLTYMSNNNRIKIKLTNWENILLCSK